jgi:glucose-1-phosphate cytidylyltransferase
MKTVILCGGLGTRLSEETNIRPKPMVEIGGRPILWNIMKIYSNYGFSDFICALGYKGEVIKDYFLNYHYRNGNVILNTLSGDLKVDKVPDENWNISLIDTGQNTMTAGRLLRLKPYLENEDTFMLTYGDGVSNVDINKLLDFHRNHGKIATVTAVRPPVRFGEMLIDSGKVYDFKEKPQVEAGWINGGFFVFNNGIFDYLIGDHVMLEREPMEKLVSDGELMAYSHSDFWQCMDTIRDKEYLETLLKDNKAPWLKK